MATCLVKSTQLDSENFLWAWESNYVAVKANSPCTLPLNSLVGDLGNSTNLSVPQIPQQTSKYYCKD